MPEVSFPSFQTHFEKSSISPSVTEEVNARKIPQTHFEESSLVPCLTEVHARPSKPQISSSFSHNKSYQILLVELATSLDELQGILVQFDTQQIEQIADKTKTTFSKLLKVKDLARQREINANKWKVVTKVIGAGMLLSSFYIAPSLAALGIFSALVKNLQVTCISQQLFNQAHLLKIQAEKARLDHEFKKGTMQQSRLTQNGGTNAFNELEEQIHLLAIALDKQAINF